MYILYIHSTGIHDPRVAGLRYIFHLHFRVTVAGLLTAQHTFTHHHDGNSQSVSANSRFLAWSTCCTMLLTAFAARYTSPAVSSLHRARSDAHDHKPVCKWQHVVLGAPPCKSPPSVHCLRCTPIEHGSAIHFFLLLPYHALIYEYTNILHIQPCCPQCPA